MKLRSHLYCLTAIIIWSSLEVTGKLVGVGIDPFTLTAWRFVIGGVVLLPFAIRQARIDKLQINRSSILRIGSLGLLNVCVSMLLLQLSIFYGKASLSAIIISMNPLFVSLFALILIHEKLSRSQIVSIILGIIGLFLIILFEHDFTNMDFVNLKLGIVLAVLAALSFGIWTVLTRSAVLVYGNTFTNALSFLLGGSVLLAVNQVLGKPFMFQFSMRNVLYMAYFGCIITGAAYLLYFQGMKHINAGSASAYFFFKPVIASLLAYVLLHETLGVGQLAGTIIVISGLLIRNSQARFLRKLFTPTRPNIT